MDNNVDNIENKEVVEIAIFRDGTWCYQNESLIIRKREKELEDLLEIPLNEVFSLEEQACQKGVDAITLWIQLSFYH